MVLSNEQQVSVENVLRSSLRSKFKSYNPEPAKMPFHTRLLGKDRMALFSFIHSLNTNFGTSIFEPVALALASSRFKCVEKHQKAATYISSEAQIVIQDIMNGLSAAKRSPNKSEEISAIRAVCQHGEMKTVKTTNIDIKLIDPTDRIYLFDLKTAKPNAGAFKEFKRTLLEWIAVTLATDPNASVQSIIAIPYNPYEPEPYNRWTMRGMLDLKDELKVAEEFWDFLGGTGTYQDLLDIFERIGIELRAEIDEYFERYK
ncbi:MAG: TdeIII family type II restriction endonuclease [Nitrospirae bacterium]|uniref:TdeIII family type II restriction endonuclease n=1 Tax=Candidatus Magnetobacterium casense TaxID=1455061 RepID=UPI00058ED5E8|nr:TdeIII family type II restriction endonuclease [Candidatus Magnetobacterium casensis]MBF0337616.1 TdeIII family type II restriction endonuclease [Nitrospirota bacterium]